MRGHLKLLLGSAAIVSGLTWATTEGVSSRHEAVALAAGFQRAEAGAAAAEQFGLRALVFASMVHGLGRRWVAMTEAGNVEAASEAARSMRNIALNPQAPVEFATLFDETGAVRWFSGEAVAPFSAAERTYFRQHRDGTPGPLISLPMDAQRVGGRILTVTIRLGDREDRFIGVVSAAMRPESIGVALTTLAPDQGEFAALLRSDGLLLAGSGEVDGRLGSRVVPEAMAAEMVRQPAGTIRTVNLLTGQAQLQAWRSIPALGVVALMGLDANVVLAPAQQQRTTLRALAAAVTAFSGLAVLALSWRMRLAEQRRAAEAEHETLARLEKIHIGLPAVIALWEVSPDGSYRRTYCGGDVPTVMGRTREEVARLGVAPLAPAGTPFAETFRTVARDGTATLEWSMQRADGAWNDFRMVANRIERRADGVSLVVGASFNITAEREAQARAQSAARLTALGEMALGLAHELKQPLQIITLAVDNAQAGLGRLSVQEVDAVFEEIVGNTMRAAAIIENVRRFARGPAEAGERRPIALGRVLDATRELLQGALIAAHVRLEISLADPALVFLGQETALEQVLANLLLNARDAMVSLPQGARRAIGISVAAAGPEADTVRIEVADTGPGLPPEVLPRLFQPFVTTKDPDRGTGLGLSICFGLVRGMGGRIEGRNLPEGGAAFSITLPAPARPAATPESAVPA